MFVGKSEDLRSNPVWASEDGSHTDERRSDTCESSLHHTINGRGGRNYVMAVHFQGALH